MKRFEIEDKYKWKLDLIYNDESMIDKDITKVKELVNRLLKYEGIIMNNASNLYEANNLLNEILCLFDKISVYSSRKLDEDMEISKYQQLFGKIEKLSDELSEKISFFSPEVLQSDFSIVKKYVLEEPRLKESLFAFEQLFRDKDHVLDKEKESLLASLGEIFNNSSNTFEMLDNVDMTFEDIKVGSEVLPLNQSNYSIYIRDKNREIRKQAFHNLYSSYDKHKNTIASIYKGSVKTDNFMANIRNYPSNLEMELYSDNIDSKLYDKLIYSVHNRLNLLNRYVDLRKQVLKLDEIHNYDLYVPLISDINKKYSYEEAKELVVNALSVLGEDYINDLKNLFNSGCIDVFHNDNKKSGAYSSGSYDTLPYVLLNFEGNYNDVSTIAHELGHSMHTFYSNNNNTFENSSYPIFLAEIASTVNEMLLNRYCYENSNDKKEKLYYLNNLLENIRTTLYRQTMFAEFEKIVHEEESNGETLNQEYLCSIYHDLNKKYYSNVYDDKEISLEWARIPHFYTSFYVYKYATGISVALKIASDILSGDKDALNNYLLFLKSGGSDYPLNILKKCGIDIVNDDTIDKALDIFSNTLDKFESVYNS